MKGIRERGSFYIIISPHSFFNPALFTLICPSGYSFSNFQKPQRLLSITSVQPIQNPERDVCILHACQFARFTIANTSTWVAQTAHFYFSLTCLLHILQQGTSKFSFWQGLSFQVQTVAFSLCSHKTFPMETSMASLLFLIKTTDYWTRAPPSDLLQCLLACQALCLNAIVLGMGK